MEKLKNMKPGKWIAIVLLFVAALACKTNYDTFEQYTKDGEKIYVGTPDTVLVEEGFNKLRFKVAINADPKIKKGVLTTTDKSVQHEFTYERTRIGRDTLSFDLAIPEGEYTFSLYLMDAAGNTSVKREISAKVFGERYQSGLINRGISDLENFKNEAAFKWMDAPPNMIRTTLTYEDALGVARTIDIPNNETLTEIDNYKLGGEFQVKSYYKPTPKAIEEFESLGPEAKFPTDYLLDKSLIKALKLPGDATAGCSGSTYERLTDGSIKEYWHSCDIPEDKYPLIMSFDLGVEANLSRFKLVERQDCCGRRGPGAYQIWASNDISKGVTADIDEVGLEAWEVDAMAKGWIKLVDVTGNTQTTFETPIPANGKTYKYFRLVAISAMDGSSITNFNEFSFWTR
jgi:hypothetical protein